MRQLFGYEYTESTHNQEVHMERQVYYESKTASKPISPVVENEINITEDWTPSSKSSDTFEDVYEIYPSMRDLSKMEMIEQFRVYKSNICLITLLAKQLSNNGRVETLANVCPAKNKTIVIFIGI